MRSILPLLKITFVLFFVQIVFITEAISQRSNIIWGTVLESKATHFECTRSRTDSKGNTVMFGYFKGTMDFMPGPGVLNVTTKGLGTDHYILKINNDGSFAWLKILEADGTNRSREICIDSQDNIIVCGEFTGKIDMDPGSGKKLFTNNNSSNQKPDLYVCKLDPDGKYLGAAQIKGNDFKRINSVITDDEDNILISGLYSGTADFDPSSQEVLLTATRSNGFICKLNKDCSYVWVRNLAGAGRTAVLKLSLDSQKNLVATGEFTRTADLDPGEGEALVTSSGNDNYTDNFVIKLDPDGQYIWSRHLKNKGSTNLLMTTVTDRQGNIFIAGDYLGTIEPDPDNSDKKHTSRGRADIYIIKLDTAGRYVWSCSIGAKEDESVFDMEVDINGDIYYSGDFGATVDFDPGSGTYQLTGHGVNGSEPFLSKLSNSGEFRWVRKIATTGAASGLDINIMPDLTYYATGNFYPEVNLYDEGYPYKVTGTGHNNIVLGKFTQAFGIDEVTACNNYTWIDGETYYEDNDEALYLFKNNEGHDTLVALRLSIIQFSTEVIKENDKLKAVQNDATYRWLDCNDNYRAVPGAVSQEFVPAYSSSFAVEVTYQDCADTSACNVISVLSSKTPESSERLYPNPVSDILYIDHFLEETSYSIVSPAGREVYSGYLETGVNEINLSGLHGGVYFIILKNKDKWTSEKLFICR